MEDTSSTTSDNCQRSFAQQNAQNGPPPRKRQKTAMFDTVGSCPSPIQNRGVLAAMNKLSKLVEHHPGFIPN